MQTVAIIVAGGTGSRAAGLGSSGPKQFRRIAGRAVVEMAASAFLDHPNVDAVLVVVKPGWELKLKEILKERKGLLEPVAGGDRRQDSVRLGLEALASLSPKAVLIHDAARPFISAGVIDRVLDALKAAPGAIPGLPVADTLKKVGETGEIVGTVDRDRLFSAQTPQGFAYSAILAAHRRAAATNLQFTDDSSIAEWAHIPVSIVPGDPANRKLTTAEDIELAEVLAAGAAPPRDIRTGTGFDVHRFGDGDAVMLCGVKVPHSQGLTGHSDADVGLHAVTDALLGAIGDGDIGSHFPPSDPQWKGASSDRFLRHAAGLVTARGGVIQNADITLVCESPKIGPYRDQMRSRIAEILEIPVDRVSVKATTSEGLGFTGRREGIAAQAIATIALPAGVRP